MSDPTPRQPPLPVVHALRAAGRTRTPWANRLGFTREVARWPAGAGFDDFAWRVAIAELAEDAPFSTLPGVDRQLVLLHGAPVELTVNDTVWRLERHAPVAFPGEAAAAARLFHGPASDLNVMTRRGFAEATLEVCSLGGPCEVTPARVSALALVVVLEGKARVRVSRRGREDLGPLDALLVGQRVLVHPVPAEPATTIALIRFSAA